MSKRYLIVSLFLILIFLLLTPQESFAHHRKRVLGEATNASQLAFPPVTAGPGFILPDSPLFFIDRTFQSVRLFAAFSSEQKAKVRTQIAGERLAELRLMLSRNNPQGISVALNELTKEAAFSAAELTEAKAQGKNIESLAKEVNLAIKDQRQILNELEHQSEGALQLQFKTARQSLKEAKVEVEDTLPEDELEKEIEEGLNDDIESEVEEAEDSSVEIENDLDELQNQATEAAAKALKRREEALRKAIEEKNEQLKKEEEKALEAEKKKQEELKKVSKEAAEQAKKAVKEAKEAAKKFQEAQKATSELKTSMQTTSSESSGSGSFSSQSSSSGSGSNSGSGKSGSDDSGKSSKN